MVSTGYMRNVGSPPHQATQIQATFKGLLFSRLERGDAHVKKLEFSKKLLIADYAVLALMITVFFVFSLTGHDTGNCSIVVSAWIAQIAISTGAYYWKAKAENLVKLPLLLLAELPEDMREKSDPNAIIEAVLGIGTHSN